MDICPDKFKEITISHESICIMYYLQRLLLLIIQATTLFKNHSSSNISEDVVLTITNLFYKIPQIYSSKYLNILCCRLQNPVFYV